jgi:hypothetical protein
MIGQIEVEVQVKMAREGTPEPDQLLEDLEKALAEIEAKYPGVITFGKFRLVNLVTGLEVVRSALHDPQSPP